MAIEQDNTIEGLLIILNTVGGDVEAGLAIADGIVYIDKKDNNHLEIDLLQIENYVIVKTWDFCFGSGRFEN